MTPAPHRRPGRRPVAALLAAVLALTGLTAAGHVPAPTGGPGDVVAGSLLVTTTAGRLPAVLDRVEAEAPRASTRRLAGGVARVDVPVGQEDAYAARLRSVPGVVAVEPDRLAATHVAPNDPWYPKQWAHGRTGAPAAWDRTTGSSDVLVAVIDTGMNGTHPDLRPNIVGQVDVSAGTPAGPERVGVDNDTCDLGHGTWVGGVVGAVGDNGSSVAGVAWDVGLLDVATNSTRAGATCDGIPFSAIIAGIDYAVSDPTRRADVVTMSLGAYLDSCPVALATAIQAARNVGAVVIASVGNGQADAATAGKVAYPAGCDGVIGVGATGLHDGRAPYSQVNGSVDVVAPGGDYEDGGPDGMVLTTNHAWTVNALTRVQGTSFSAPYVAGVAALLRSVWPVAGPDGIEQVLEDTARDLGPAGRDKRYGHGIVQADDALAAVLGTLPSVPQPTSPTDDEPAPDSSAGTPAPERSVVRIVDGDPTEPIPTAVAISRQAFPADGADHVVLARDDLFADALAGSTLGNGRGPLLYTRSTGALATASRREIQRVLPDDGLVYLLGGPVALPSSLEGELGELGYRTRRLSGQTREDTAVAVATEAARRMRELGVPTSSDAILATSTTWPDAATAGSLGATFGIPIVLTPPDRLHPATEAYLDRLHPRRLYVTGGTVAVADATARRAADVAGADLVRLAGATRIETAVAVAREYDRLHQRLSGGLPRFAMAVNMVRGDAWAHVLAGSALSGQSTGVFVPVDGAAGDVLTPGVQTWLRDRMDDSDDVLGAVIGGTDVVTTSVQRRFEDVLGAG